MDWQCGQTAASRGPATVSGTLFCLVMAGKSIKRWMVSRQHGRLEAAES